MHRPWKPLAVVLLALLCVCATAASAHAAPRPAAPGTLLEAVPFSPRVNGAPALVGARAWKVRFQSTTALARPLVETGTVLVPRARWKGSGPRPLVASAPGTVGMADRCAVSHQLDGGVGYDVKSIKALLARGWAVAIPDYPGLGTPGEHPYAIGPALGPSVLDVVRAARRLKAAGLAARGPLGITGYSEGGIAAAWALELQSRYAPELRIAAAAVGGVMADPGAIVRALNGGPFAFLLVYAKIGLDAAYPGTDILARFDPAGRAYAAQLASGCLVDAALGLRVFRMRELTGGVDLDARADVRRRARENTLGSVTPAPPTLMVQGTDDQVLPFPQAAALTRRWCARGANVRMDALVGRTHTSGGDDAVAPSTEWLAKGFAHTTPPRPKACGG